MVLPMPTKKETILPVEENQFPIEIYYSWCKGCGLCAAVCPNDVLEMAEDGYPYAKNPERCTSCGMCDLHCPDFAITGMKKRSREEIGKEKPKRGPSSGK